MEELTAMGFSSEMTTRALRLSDGNVLRAVELILAGNLGENCDKEEELPSLTEIEHEQLVTRAVFQQNSAGSRLSWLGRALRRHETCAPLDALDKHGLSPLSLALCLGSADAAHALLDAGADPRKNNEFGWDALQLTAGMGEQAVELMTDMLLHKVLLQQKDLERHSSSLARVLCEMPDFTLDIEWRVETSVPGLSRLASLPSDTMKMWKKGSHVRFDWHVLNISQRLESQMGHMSVLFLAEKEGEFSRANVFLLDRKLNTVKDALEKFRDPSFEEVNWEARKLLSSNAVARAQLDHSDVRIFPRKTLFRRERVENVGEYECRVFGMDGLRFRSVTLSRSGCVFGCLRDLSVERYLTDDDAGDTVRRHLQESVTVQEKAVSATLWVSSEPEQHGLKLEVIRQILEIIRPVSSHIGQIASFLAMDFRGFPVRLSVPLLPGVQAGITFANFVPDAEIDHDIFEVPANFRRRLF